MPIEHSRKPRAKGHVFLNVAELEKARINRGLFKTEVARLAGVSQSSVYEAFSSGKCGVVVARKLAAALGLDLAGLWRETGAVHRA